MYSEGSRRIHVSKVYRSACCEYSVVYSDVFTEYIRIHHNTYKYHNDTKRLESIQMDTSEYGQNTRIFENTYRIHPEYGQNTGEGKPPHLRGKITPNPR